ncbi:MAG: flagellar biosynthetic protein FliO [Alphaproteobacteria bacterium]|nr:flagellar biosynthetic protein FliO [Alphaproteobacteria bacterium]
MTDILDLSNYIQFLAALIAVILLIVALGAVARRLFNAQVGARAVDNGKRLQVVDAIPIDARRRLILVRRDDSEHLLLLGPDGDRVVESGIPVDPDAAEQRRARTQAASAPSPINLETVRRLIGAASGRGREEKPASDEDAETRDRSTRAS